MSIDRYTDDLTIKLSSGKTLTLDADTVTITGDLTDTSITGTLTVSGITTVGGYLIPNGDIFKASTLSFICSGSSTDLNIFTGNDVDVDAQGNIELTSSDDVIIVSGNNFTIDCANNIEIEAEGNISIEADGNITLQPDADSSAGSLTLADTMTYGVTNNTGHIAAFFNTTTSAIGDVLQLGTSAETPNDTTSFITFTAGGSADIKGKIRGSSSDTAAAFYTEGTSGDRSAYGEFGNEVEVNTSGDITFVSGSADYGEFVKCGDISEWPVGPTEGKKYLGIPEGYIVYVRNEAFYKEGPGTPMVVTHRPIIVGNERDDHKVGQVLSFIGQVPTYVSGKVKTGDFIISTGNYFGKAISPEKITFREYTKVVGTAWSSSDKEDIKKVMCSIGVKNTH